MNDDLRKAIMKTYYNVNGKVNSTTEDISKYNKPTLAPKITRLTSEGNICNITSVMKSIKSIIDVVFVDDSINFTISDNDVPLKIPAITYDVVSRELSSKTPLSSMKSNSLKEYIDGVPTGDNFEIFTTFFDCVVEFNFYGVNKVNSISIQEKFEEMIELYKGYLKKIGLSNMYFLKEIPGEESLKNKKYSGVTLIYFMEIQRIKSIRASSLKSVSVNIEQKLKSDNPSAYNVLDELSINNKLK